MSYNFRNMDDDALEALSSAVYRELRDRSEAKFKANPESYPVPELTHSRFDSVVAYRRKYGTGLAISKMVVDHYWDKQGESSNER